MKRVTLRLPGKLIDRAKREAKRRNASLSTLVRSLIELDLKDTLARRRDPPFALQTTFEDNLPGDVSANLDKYLYPTLLEAGISHNRYADNGVRASLKPPGGKS